MPWKECHVMDERSGSSPGCSTARRWRPLCAEFGISRKTGYKIYHRYKGCGVDGLTDRSRRPLAARQQLPMAIEKLIVRLKREYPSWGAPKIRERLRRRCAGVQCPAISTVHAVLDRHGLVNRRRAGAAPGRRARRSRGPIEPERAVVCRLQGRIHARQPALLLSADHHRFRQPYLLTCEALSTTQERYAFAVFERAFQGLWAAAAIRTDNGVPFASAHALYGLSKLAVWWLRLGIQIERIKPGHPEQNGRHERMHLTLKTEATKPAAANVPPAAGALRHLHRTATTTSGPTRPSA